MDKVTVLRTLEELVATLQQLDIHGDALDAKDRLVNNITKLSNLIMINSLKEGTVALRHAFGRLKTITEKIEREKKKLDKIEKNVKTVSSVLGAIAGVIRFI